MCGAHSPSLNNLLSGLELLGEAPAFVLGERMPATRDERGLEHRDLLFREVVLVLGRKPGHGQGL